MFAAQPAPARQPLLLCPLLPQPRVPASRRPLHAYASDGARHRFHRRDYPVSQLRQRFDVPYGYDFYLQYKYVN
jgi:hypothetical protein